MFVCVCVCVCVCMYVCTAKTFDYLHKTFVINVLMKEPYVFSLTVMLLNDYLVTGE